MEKKNKNNILEKRMPKDIPHHECGGQLHLVNGPVQAGSEGGEFYVYECDECHAMEIVGGNRINYSSS